MKFEIKAYNLQELGQRQNQEDSLFPALGKSTAEDRLFILCDGMGGHEKGEVASATVCEVMSKTILSLWKPSESLTDEILQKALNAAYDALDAKDNGGERRMGTTMTLLCLHAGGATVAHIGDSRIYQLRPASNGNPARIVFRTEDHSLVNALVKIGEITEEEAKTHPQRNVITRAMQPGQDRAQADIAHLTDIQPGDYFYMCSDGMLEETSDENILYIITKPIVSDGKKIEMLRNVTKDNSDNHTAHLIFMEKVEGTIVPPVGAVNGGSMSATTHRDTHATKNIVDISATNQSNKHIPEPDSNMVWAIICLSVCLPIGIMALVESVKVDRLYSDGDINAAIKASNKSKAYCCWAFILLFLFTLFIIFAFMFNQ